MAATVLAAAQGAGRGSRFSGMPLHRIIGMTNLRRILSHLHAMRVHGMFGAASVACVVMFGRGRGRAVRRCRRFLY